MTKYKLTDETKEHLGRTLHRIGYEAAVRYVESLEKIQAEVK